MLVLLAKYPLDRLGTILGATFCERFDQTGQPSYTGFAGIAVAPNC